MHTSTSTKARKFSPYAIASALMLGTGSAGALIAGVTPASAANLATQPDAQVAVFMVPLALLVLTMLFEVCRIALHGQLPAERPVRRANPRHWSAGRSEG